ncbi:MAG: hypothetical protein HRU81_04580 [Gammaproteobacteria bacterium]|nr:MAG: hypothetical protein HRU81_04580 [Gammaproteobacteria bacterium]
MVIKALVDNWTLQNAGELLHWQCRGECAHELDITASAREPKYQDVSQDVVGLACLCQLLQHLVLNDELVVDAAFISSWTDLPSTAALHSKKLIVGREYSSSAALWVPRREILANQLSRCAPGIQAGHDENKKEFEQRGLASDAMLSQVLWGAAGMLARAEMSRLPYTPHPLRERLLMHSGFLGGPPNAREMLTKFVDSEQCKLYERTGTDGIFGTLRLPPIVVEVISECATLGQLIPTAIALRSRYAELRGWLGELQQGLDGEDMREVLARRKTLQSVSVNIDRLIGQSDSKGIASVQLGIDFQPKVGVNVGCVATALRNSFGVRSQICRLILAPPGKSAFRKMLRLLGEEHTDRGTAIERDFYEFQSR